MSSSNDRDQKREAIAAAIITTSEVQEILGVNRARVNRFVKEGRLVPLKRGIFLKDDVLDFKSKPRIPGRPPEKE